MCFADHDWKLQSMLSGFVHVVSGSICGFDRKFFVAPGDTKYARLCSKPQHGRDTLPQSVSCNLRAPAKSKCCGKCWWKQHLPTIGSVGEFFYI